MNDARLRRRRSNRSRLPVSALRAAAAGVLFATLALAQDAPPPTMTVPNLAVRTAAGGLTTPIGLAFLSDDDWLVIEKNTGQVKLVANGVVGATVLDLGVNNFSERGLLGIAVHPDFDENNFVYLFCTCKAPPPPTDNPFVPTLTECADTPDLGADSDQVLEVPLLGNRIDRFVWNSETSTLTWDRNLVKLRAFQNDAAPEPVNQGDAEQPARGNHD